MEAKTGSEGYVDLNSRLMFIAGKIVGLAGGKVSLVRREADDSTTAEPEAADFLKVEGKRLGRDIHLYSFMGKVASNGMATLSFLEEVALPLKDTLEPEAHAAIMADVEQLGAEVFSDEMLPGWHDLFVKPE